MVKTKRQQIFEILDQQGYILDDQTASILGNDKIHNVYTHIASHKRLHRDIDFCKDKNIREIRKGIGSKVQKKRMKQALKYKTQEYPLSFLPKDI